MLAEVAGLALRVLVPVSSLVGLPGLRLRDDRGFGRGLRLRRGLRLGRGLRFRRRFRLGRRLRRGLGRGFRRGLGDLYLNHGRLRIGEIGIRALPEAAEGQPAVHLRLDVVDDQAVARVGENDAGETVARRHEIELLLPVGALEIPVVRAGEVGRGGIGDASARIDRGVGDRLLEDDRRPDDRFDVAAQRGRFSVRADGDIAGPAVEIAAGGRAEDVARVRRQRDDERINVFFESVARSERDALGVRPGHGGDAGALRGGREHDLAGRSHHDGFLVRRGEDLFDDGILREGGDRRQGKEQAHRQYERDHS